MQDLVLRETSDGVTVVTLNRPDALNALSVAMRNAIANTFLELREDEATKVIILTGAGRAFTAGLDLKELGQQGMGTKGSAQPTLDLHDAIMNVGKPLIGAINGFAITGGFEIALMCDILVASTAAKFADTHVRMGVVPGWGLSQRLSTLVGASRARQLSFTGNYLDAETACRWGLVNDVLEPEALLPHCMRIARDICSANPDTLKAVKYLIDFGVQEGLASGLAEEARLSGATNRGIDAQTLETRRQAVQARGRDQTL